MASIGGQAEGLFAGEVLDHVAGHPCLYKFCPGPRTTPTPDKPLVVFLPGGAHLARIAYGGHADYRPADFLAHWLHQVGFPFLAISYPIESSDPTVLAATSAGFRLRDWGRQAAEVTKKVVDRHRLESTASAGVILLSWSMGGRVVVPFTKALAAGDDDGDKRGLRVELYVALAATPGLPGMMKRPGRGTLQRSDGGYAAVARFPDIFLGQISRQGVPKGGQVEAGDEAIIPEAVFLRQYYGHTPINLLGWGLKHEAGADYFVDDGGQADADADASDFAAWPWIATLYPEDAGQDARHALADRSTWAFVLTMKLTMLVEAAAARRPRRDDTTGPPETSSQAVAALVAAAPDRLSCRMPGNHYFFLGESGARRTVDEVVRCWHVSRHLRAEMAGLLGTEQGE